MYWSSLLEIMIFSFCLLLFFSDPADMAYIFMHMLHVGRSIMGFCLIKKIPKSHDLIQKFKSTIGEEETPLQFQDFREKATQQMRVVFSELFSSLSSYLKFYLLYSLFSVVLDFIDFIIQLVRFGRFGDVSLD